MKKTLTIATIAISTMMTFSGCQSEKKDVDINVSATLVQVLNTDKNESIPVLLNAIAPNDEVFGDCANTKIKMTGTATPNFAKSSFELNITSVTCPFANDVQVNLSNISYGTTQFTIEAKPIEKQAGMVNEESKTLVDKFGPSDHFRPILFWVKDPTVVVNIKSMQKAKR